MAQQSAEAHEIHEELSESKSPTKTARPARPMYTFLPDHPTPTPEQIAAFVKAADKLQAEMAAKGITEEEIFNDIDELHRRRNR